MAGETRDKGAGRAIAGYAARKGGTLARKTLEKNLHIGGHSAAEIRKIVAGQGFGKSIVLAAMVKLATRSVPGALVVGGGLVAKALYDRRKRRRERAERGGAAEE